MDRICTLLADNKPGVLDRIAGVIRRYGWNIISITAVPIDGTSLTELTILMTCSLYNQLPDDKLRDIESVRSVETSDAELFDTFDMLIARGTATTLDKSGLSGSAARRVDSGDTVTLFWTDTPDNIKVIHEQLKNVPGVTLTHSGSAFIRK